PSWMTIAGSSSAMDCRRHKYNTHDRAGDRRSSDPPLISVSALLQLAEWVRRFHSKLQGDVPCEGMTTERPPFAEPTHPAERSVDDVARGDTSPDSSDTQSDHRSPMSANASGSTGGAT